MNYYRQSPGYRYGSGIQFGVPPVTPMVKALIVANVAVWAVQWVARMQGIDLAAYLGLVPLRVVQGWVWQLGTYLFLHSTENVWHLIINMLMLWMFGGEMERYWGGRAFLRYYLVCGIGAGAFILAGGVLFGGLAAVVPTIGASGAIYGLLLAYGVVFANRIIYVLLVFPMRARTAVWIFAAIEFLGTLGVTTGVSHVAHLGGMAVGYLYLKRAWRIGDFWRELKWRYHRRRFRVIPRDDHNDWIH